MTDYTNSKGNLTRDEKIKAIIEMQKECPFGKPAVIISFEEYKRKYERMAAAEAEEMFRAAFEKPAVELNESKSFEDSEEPDEYYETVNGDSLELVDGLTEGGRL